MGLTNLDALAMIHKNSSDDTQPGVVICSNTMDEFFNNEDVLLGEAKDKLDEARYTIKVVVLKLHACTPIF